VGQFALPKIAAQSRMFVPPSRLFAYCTELESAMRSPPGNIALGQQLSLKRMEPILFRWHHMSDSSHLSARTRSGNPCQSPATKKGRCRFHGGASGSGWPSWQAEWAIPSRRAD
jgi:hypothetical protein